MKIKLLAAVLLLGSSGFAMAADPALPIEEIPTGFNWTGGYVGGQAGYAWGDSHYSNTEYDDYADYDPDGVFGGIYAGYNHQFINNVVLGVDADLNVSGVDGDTTFYLNDIGYEAIPGAEAELKYSGAIRGRLGYAVDRFMPYIAGGLSFGKYDFNLPDGSSFLFEESKTLTGWNIGAGVEYAATDNILIRAEYRYTDFGSKSFDHGNSFADGAKIDLSTNDIRLGVAYKF